MPLTILGTICNFVEHPSATPLEQAHDEGLTFVAMDSRSFPYWNGLNVGRTWIVRRVLRARLDQLRPWPDTGWKFTDQAQAQQAYLTLRQHFLSRLPGASSQPEVIEGELLLAGQQAWAEGIYWNGELVAWISCDLSTDALTLTQITRAMEEFAPDGGPPARCASYATQVTEAYLAVAPGPQGYDHVAVVFSPGEETDAITDGLLNAVNDGTAQPFCIDVPSGILMLSWGR